MEILTTAEVAGQTLTINDSWDIGNGIIMRIKELFIIEDQIYVSLVTENQSMMSVKISLDSEEKITPNRYINNAELWVRKNIQLFETI